MNNFKLKALITGGTSGLGKSIAEGFADAGYKVIATGIGKIPKNKNNIEFCSLDVLDEISIKKKIEKIDYINVLINAAGTIARNKELQPHVFSQVVDVNLNGTMRVCSEARRLLSKSKGSIINIASMLSYFGGGVVPGYSASKGGIVQLTKSLSIAYSQDKIRVNAIAPGWISTPMTEELKLDTKRNENIIIGGDFNIIPSEEDVHNPKNYENDALFRLEIRKKLRELINLGFHDAYRYIHPDKEGYTFWDYTSGAWQKNNGMRIDHFLVSNSLINIIKDIKINKFPRGRQKPSDHTPIEIELT